MKLERQTGSRSGRGQVWFYSVCDEKLHQVTRGAREEGCRQAGRRLRSAAEAALVTLSLC